jgi:PAT family beta-lactamase induction signal transducer AmpG
LFYFKDAMTDLAMAPADGAATSRISWPHLLAFGALYMSFGATLGFLATGAPLILRLRGVALTQVGLLQAINLPLGLTFLWAAALDRVRWPALPHRLGWIALLQAATVISLGWLALSESASLPLLFALGIMTATSVATMDISLEALVVETVTPGDRPAVSSAKFCGVSIGGIVGAGILVGSYEQLGWFNAVAILAAMNLLCLLPLLAYPETRLRRAEALREAPGGRLARLRRLASHILVLGLYFAALHAVCGLNGLVLVDLGVSAGVTGLVAGTVSPVINLVMALASAPLVRRFGTVPLITVSAAGVLATTALLAGAAAVSSPWLAVGAAVACAVCAGGLGVPVFNMLYRWAEGPGAAANYSVLFGAAFFASMPVRVGGPALAAWTGWGSYLALAALAFLVAFLLLRRSIARTLADRRA